MLEGRSLAHCVALSKGTANHAPKRTLVYRLVDSDSEDSNVMCTAQTETGGAGGWADWVHRRAARVWGLCEWWITVSTAATIGGQRSEGAVLCPTKQSPQTRNPWPWQGLGWGGAGDRGAVGGRCHRVGGGSRPEVGWSRAVVPGAVCDACAAAAVADVSPAPACASDSEDWPNTAATLRAIRDKGGRDSADECEEGQLPAAAPQQQAAVRARAMWRAMWRWRVRARTGEEAEADSRLWGYQIGDLLEEVGLGDGIEAAKWVWSESE